MKMQLKSGELVSVGIRRVAIRLMLNTLLLLSPRGSAHAISDEAIHDVRRNLKRFRAFLRLARKFDHCQELLSAESNSRKAAKTLASLRDASVLHAMLANLELDFAAEVSAAQFASARQLLDCEYRRQIRKLPGSTVMAGQHSSTTSRVKPVAASAQERKLFRTCWPDIQESDTDALIGHARMLLLQVQSSVELWKPASITYHDALKRLRRLFRRAKRHFEEVSSRCSYANAAPPGERKDIAENLHSMRKDLKSLLYDIDFIRGHDSPPMLRITKQISALEELLGSHHDHTMLIDILARSETDAGAEVSGLLDLLENRRLKLERKARGFARRLFKVHSTKAVERLA